MGPGRKQREREQRREALLEAASRVFGRKPFDEATMQEVAAEAQIGMQGLYEHFPGKQELYEEVMLHRSRAFHARAEAAVAGPGTPLDRLRALALAYVSQFAHKPMVLPMFIRDRSLFDWGLDSRFAPRLKDVYLKERAHLVGLVREAVAQGQLRDLDPDFLAQLVLDVLQASLHAAHHRGGEDPEVVLARAMDCLLQGVGGRP